MTKAQDNQDNLKPLKGVELSQEDSIKNPYEGPDDPKRRGFLVGMLALFGAIWAAGAAYPLFRYLLPKKGETVVVTELEVAEASELAPGSGKNFKFGSIPGLVIRDDAGNLHAYNAKCSHLGCTVQYKKDINNIYCACHGGVYDLESGKNIAGPPPAPLDLLKAEEIDGKIVVKRA